MASSSSRLDKYDVFLSFRGNDTRFNFTGNLYARLREAGFHTFLDDDGIDRGENIKLELENAIQDSRVSIVVLSRSYASSSWCLDELVMILRRRKAGQLLVLPVFYEVDPSEVRKQTGFLAEAFLEHERRHDRRKDIIEGWREALREVANLAGIHYTSNSDGYEYNCIDKIVKEIQHKMGRPPLTIGTYIVGIRSHIRNINKILKRNSNDVSMLVIYGIGGIGKTTITKLIYNENYTRFNGASFLSSVREVYEKHNGLLKLQRRFLSDFLCRDVVEKPKNIDYGWDCIKRALRFKGSFLLVLDDVDSSSQLDDILQMTDWLSEGSKVIITTRRLDLPRRAHKAYEVYEVGILSPKESLDLFTWHAFGKIIPEKDYIELAKCYVKHCNGLPLALKVVGSSLFKKTLAQWKDQLEKLKEFPKADITKALKISFESLEDDNDKNIFLDIACFFVGKDKDFTMSILQGCDFYVAFGIQNLIDRCLLTIDQKNKLEMHPLIQDMGKQVIYEESKYPERRSRLWNYKDSMNVLRSKTGTRTIEGLVLNWKNSNAEALETDAFKRMDKLRILRLDYALVRGSYKIFPKMLKWLCWHGFSFKSIPTNFPLEELLFLDLRHSKLRQLWKGTKFLGLLKILNLNHSPLLVESPDFSTTPNIEKLLLKDCPNLVEIHASLSTLEKLLLLNLKNCKRLRKLPKNISLVKSLEKLIISGCSSLKGAAEELKKMSSLKSFDANGIALERVLSTTFPEESSRSWLTSISSPFFFKMKGTRQILWTSLPSSLVTLSLMYCNLSDRDFPQEFSNMALLKNLSLDGNPIHYLPNCIRSLQSLRKLSLGWCVELRLVELSSFHLENLSVYGCCLLEKIVNLSENTLCRYEYRDCKNICQVQNSFRVKPMRDMNKEQLDTSGFFNLLDYHAVEVVYEEGVFSTSFPGNEVPEWFTYKSKTSFISLVVPSRPNLRIRGLNLCHVYFPIEDLFIIGAIVINKSKKLLADCVFNRDPTYFGFGRKEPIVLLSYLPFGFECEGGDHMEVFFIWNNFEDENERAHIKDCGIHFLYDEDDNNELHNLKSELDLSGSLDRRDLLLDADNCGSLVPKGFFDGPFRLKSNWSWKDYDEHEGKIEEVKEDAGLI